MDTNTSLMQMIGNNQLDKTFNVNRVVSSNSIDWNINFTSDFNETILKAVERRLLPPSRLFTFPGSNSVFVSANDSSLITINSTDHLSPHIPIFTLGDLWAQNEEFARHMIPAMLFVAFLMIIGLPGNCLVVYVYGFRFKSATQHVLIVCLACFDLVMCVVAMPSEIADMRFHHMFSNATACKLLRFLMMYVSIASCLTLISVAYDRHKRITKPLDRQLTPKTAKIWTCINLFVALAFSWPIFVMTGLKQSETKIPGLHGQDCSFSEEFDGTKYPLAFNGVLGIGFLASIALLSIFYFRIWRAARSRKQSMAKRYTGTLASVSDSTNSSNYLKPIGQNGKLPKEKIMCQKQRKQPPIENTLFSKDNAIQNTLSQNVNIDYDNRIIFSDSNSIHISSIGEPKPFSLSEVYEENVGFECDTDDRDDGRISIELFMEYFPHLIGPRSKPIELPPDIDKDHNDDNYCEQLTAQEKSKLSDKYPNSQENSIEMCGIIEKYQNHDPESCFSGLGKQKCCPAGEKDPCQCGIKAEMQIPLCDTKRASSSNTQNSLIDNDIEVAIPTRYESKGQMNGKCKYEKSSSISELQMIKSSTFVEHILSTSCDDFHSAIENTTLNSRQNLQLSSSPGDETQNHSQILSQCGFSTVTESRKIDFIRNSSIKPAVCPKPITSKVVSSTEDTFTTTDTYPFAVKHTSNKTIVTGSKEFEVDKTISITKQRNNVQPIFTLAPKTTTACFKNCDPSSTMKTRTLDEEESRKLQSQDSSYSCISETGVSTLSPSTTRSKNLLSVSLDKTTIVALVISCVFVLSFLPYLVVMSIRGLKKEYYANLDLTSLCFYQILLR